MIRGACVIVTYLDISFLFYMFLNLRRFKSSFDKLCLYLEWLLKDINISEFRSYGNIKLKNWGIFY